MSEYKKLSHRLREEQARGLAPDWMHPTGYQILRQKGYISDSETVLERFQDISRHLSNYLPDGYRSSYRKKFEDLLISGKYSLSTPAFCNINKPYKGLPVSCSGGYVQDSIESFYTMVKEIALLTKAGFGTSCYVGDVRPRGSKIMSGGTADGIVPLMDTFFDTTAKVRQTSRRGAVAAYFPIDHPDAKEAFRYLENNLKGTNAGINITDEFIDNLKLGHPEAKELFQELCYIRAIGKGYVHFVDRANRARPDVFKRLNMEIKGSNLCSEIALPSDDDYSFTCVLSSLNLIHWDSITDEDIMTSLVMLDCINEDLIRNAPRGLERVKRFAKSFRAIGLGVMGFASYLQESGIVFDSLEAKFKNQEIFERLSRVGKVANKHMGEMLGVPRELTKEGHRNATQFAIAPTLSTAVIMGGVSQGIEPIFANTYIHEGPAGDIRRASPWLVRLLKEKRKWNKEVLDSIVENESSIAHLDFLSDEEKALGKTAYEIDQYAILRMAEDRAGYIDQGQSVNLYFNALADEKDIGDIHRYAFFDLKKLKSLYYIRSMSSANSKIKHAQNGCEACAS